MTDPTTVPVQDAVTDHVPEPRTSSRWGDAERARERELIAVMASVPEDDPAHRRARDELVTLHLPLVHFLARRFRDRGEPLEDLYVRPELRGAGYGTALLRALARVCQQRGYRRLEWWVLDWNEPALGFYRSLGAAPMDEWTVQRVTGDALAALAAGTG